MPGRVHVSRMDLPLTVMSLAGSGLAAGPWATEPSAMWNLLPWQGQSIVPSATRFTVQPWCVQIAEKALNSSFFGWVTTIFWFLKTLPPPTGMSPVDASSRLGEALVDDEPLPLLLPHPTHTAASAPAP